MFEMTWFHQSIGACNWQPFSKCETDFGACIPSRGHYGRDNKPIKCHWRPSVPYNTCIAERTKAELRKAKLF